MKNLIIMVCCCLPLKHLQLNSAFGYRVHPITKAYKFHSGIDLHARHDTVFAITSGQATIDYNNLLGLFIRITDNPLSCTYGHLSTVLIGHEQVIAGSAIAITGTTGNVTGEHLHLSINFDGQPIDPIPFLYQSTRKPN